MFIREIMTKDVITVSTDTFLSEVGRLLKEKRVSGLPVIDNSGELVGIITLTDILKILKEVYQWQELQKKVTGLPVSAKLGRESLNTRVGQVMTKDVISLEENDTLNDAIHLMFSKGIHTIPIVKDKKLIGVVGKRDVVFSCF